ncbi:hypothetical protein [Tahibacter harae]|uniref:Uncharacterized protein n=1 Tax=Tahibacter harae TaxID=2963937 RepID=A0ABT1QV83_9GAMM|nr:hypothetical protein [Tahibacter harae]MCQ4166199.1 hypothetical protein [Tahibacter harae]
MHLLWRTISAYSDGALCLGVFRQLELAEQAKRDYSAALRNGEIADRWAEQAYRPGIDVDADLRTVSDLRCREILPSQSKVLVVSHVEEAFGQTHRCFVAICGTGAAAQREERQINAQRQAFPYYVDIECLRLDELVLQPVSAGDRLRYPGS